ncbi:MAG: indolepyruvate oxidoreductase subunit beta [Candidatus Omnitrophota bacterium]
MKCDIVLAGVGGQGILSIATVIGYAAVESGLYLKQAEVHGMSQRGGAVLSHLRISSKEIFSDLVPEGRGDMIISAEPMESLRYIPFLSPGGWLVTNSNPFINIPNYPPLESIMTEIQKQPHHLTIDADGIAKQVGNARAVNMVIAGAASVFIDIPSEKMEAGIRFIFSRKGDAIVQKNLEAFNAGKTYAKQNR